MPATGRSHQSFLEPPGEFAVVKEHSQSSYDLLKPMEFLGPIPQIVLQHHERLDGSGYRITYPTKRIGDRDVNVYHPINRATSQAIENALISKIKDVMKMLDTVILTIPRGSYKLRPEAFVPNANIFGI